MERNAAAGSTRGGTRRAHFCAHQSATLCGSDGYCLQHNTPLERDLHMVFDQSLANRVRPLLSRRKGFSERKMFGGIGFLLDGNMCVGVWKEFLILRIGQAACERALAEPFVREFDITGRALKGWVMVEPAGIADDGELSERVKQAVKFVRTLP